MTFDSTISWGQCHFRRTGDVNLCLERRVVGVSPGGYKQHRAFAEYLALPTRVLYRRPDSLGFEQATFVEPVSIAVRAVRHAGEPSGLCSTPIYAARSSSPAPSRAT